MSHVYISWNIKYNIIKHAEFRGEKIQILEKVFKKFITYIIYEGDLMEIDHVEELNVDGRIILKWIFET
jgi:hypothetical protein